MYNSGIFRNLFISLFFLSFITFGCESETGPISKLADNRFTKVVLAENLDQPMQFEILEDGRVLFVEREGAVKVYKPETQQVKVLADIPVSTGYYSESGEVLQSEGEDGMQGVVLDPDFKQNGWIYLFYSPKEGNSGSILTRYEWTGDELNMESKKVLLEVPNQRRSCCHLGGGMVFDSEGNLYLSTGDNTPNAPDGYAPLDERSGKSRHDAQRSSGNTNDLRGAILRIHPEADGTYSIPEGNLFPEGTPNTRPEIYTMGNRNPYRLSIDSKTGWLYWGEVGPHGTRDSLGRGPKSYDEFNQAKEAGNYGWPYFIADNKVYWDYNYATGESDEKFDPADPINDSHNNTGLEELPPALPAFIWYPQTTAEAFPIPGSGSNSALGGPVHRRADYNNPKRPFPLYYEGKWFITDWSRGWIMVITMDGDGNYKSMERFLPDLTLQGPNDMDFGPEGDLYVLEYGRGPYVGNPEAKLIRIEYNDGNRKPIVQATADKTAGSVPFEVQLSSAGTEDYDNDPLSYEWRIKDKSSNEPPQVFNEAYPVVTLSDPGIYEAVLTVSDSYSTQKSKPIKLVAGNEPPVVQFDLHGANRNFAFPGRTINYEVRVEDKEDGSLSNQKISPSDVLVSIDYLPEGLDLSKIEQRLQKTDALEPIEAVVGQDLINKSDCKACHTVNTKTIGPSFSQIAEKYKGEENAKAYLSDKIISGGSGVWGEVAMPPHPTMSKNEVTMIVDYILNVQERQKVKSMPVSGTYITDFSHGEKNNGNYVFRVSYTDKGNSQIPSLSTSDLIMLREPVITVSEADKMEDIILNHHIGRNASITPENVGAYLKFNNIDLKGIKNISFVGSNLSKVSDDLDWLIEIRLDSPDGELIGQTADSLSEEEGEASEVSAAIDTVEGIYDLYFVFKSKDKKISFDQIQIKRIRFIPE